MADAIVAISSPSSFHALKNLPKLSLPALAPVQVNIRTVTLHRNISGDFGFNVRRTQIPDKQGKLHAVAFVEPVKFRDGPPRPNDIRYGLLPGDQLLRINGTSIDVLSRSDLSKLMEHCGPTVELTVRAAPELAELCDRNEMDRSAAGDSLMLPATPKYQAVMDTPEEERCWLIHKNGFTLARLLETLPDGRMRIKVIDLEMDVDVTDIDKANPSSLDRVRDLISLRYINETSVLHVLRQRYGSNLFYTYAGPRNMICLASESPKTATTVSLFKGCRRQQIPPHIYSSAQQAYRALQMSGRNQCIILSGTSGSGKTMQMRNLCRYFCEVAGWTKALSYDTISSALFVLESFGNCSTKSNVNSTRFLMTFSLSFDTIASLRNAFIQTFLLEKTRVNNCVTDGRVFHVIHYFLQGADPELVAVFKKKNENSVVDYREGWLKLLDCFTKLGFTEKEKSAIISILAAVLHLIFAEATQSDAQRSQFIRIQHAQQAASLLGLEMEQLTSAVFRKNLSHAVSNNPVSRFALSTRDQTGQEALNRFIACLYNELFNAVVRLLNRRLGEGGSTSSSTITIVDYPGSEFGSFSPDETHPRGLNDLLYNYVSERFAELYHDVYFNEPLEMYKREQVEADVEQTQSSPHEICRLIDQRQQLSNCVDIELRSTEKRGLMCILDEEVLFPAATDDSFLERIFVHLADSHLIRRGTNPLTFVLRHGLGSSCVTYSVQGWIKAAQSGYTDSSLTSLLCSSNNLIIGSMFSPVTNPVADNATLKMRKATQTIKLDAAGVRVISGFFADFCFQLDYITSYIKRTAGLHFVHCIRPLSAIDLHMRPDELLNIQYVRNQLRHLSLVNSARAASQGFPEQIPYKYFRCRFQCLLKEQNTSIEYMDDRTISGKILEDSGAFPHRYRLGLSQVLLRSDLLDELEERRELCLNGVIEHFQQICRKYLAAKWLAKRRVQEIAIRCIQRNGRAYAKVHEWPWWRLYIRVSPLLAATRNDRENREWEQKLDEKENKMQEFRIAKNRLEARVLELEQMLAVERGNAQSMNDALEREVEHRLQTEKQVLVLQQRFHDSKDDSRISSSCSSHSRLDQSVHMDAKTVELQKEVAALRESDSVQRLRAQKAMQQLKDVENELRDLRAKNDVLEKKYKKYVYDIPLDKCFGTDLKTIKDNNEKERKERIKAEREREEAVINSERRFMELQNMKAENGELRQSVAKLRKELEELGEVKEGSVESEFSSLHKTKHILEMKCAEQEEELNELTDKMKQLEQTVTRLEMAAERSRTERLRDLEAKDNEIDELRSQYQRRVRAFEEQLADLQDTNSSLVKQNRMLEGRARDIDNYSISFETSSGHYKRDLRKALALLRDTQRVLARERENSLNQSMICQLQEQLMDAEAAKLSALRGRHSLESELAEVRAQLEAALTAKNSAEDRALVLFKEKSSALALVEEQDEQVRSLLKKYKAAVQQSAVDSIKIADQFEQMADMEKDKEKLREQLNDVSSALEYHQQHSVEKHKLLLAEQKIRDLETKLELEISQKLRLEALMVKASDEVESLKDQIQELNNLRERDLNINRKIRKDVSMLQEQLEDLRKREMDLVHKCKQLVSITFGKVELSYVRRKNCEDLPYQKLYIKYYYEEKFSDDDFCKAMEREKMELERQTLIGDLQCAEKRIDDLQKALSKDLSDREDCSDDEDLLSIRNGSLTGMGRL
uniref:Myosin motor domain-containing protein n=1 Tax=Setaria digitata TaxID=48799 RepID=A0A915PS61_9BILA